MSKHIYRSGKQDGEHDEFQRLLVVLWYNGYYNDFMRLFDYIKNVSEQSSQNERFHTVFMPEWLQLKFEDPDSPMRILWSVIIMHDFGDYGTSPRSGWIEDAKKAWDFVRPHYEEFAYHFDEEEFEAYEELKSKGFKER